MRSVPDPENT